MKPIGEFIAEVQEELFTSFEAREVFSKILPTFDGETIQGDPFTTENKLFKARLESANAVRKMLVRLDQATRKLPQTEANALLYIATRDLTVRLERYLQFAQDQEHGLVGDSRLVATRT